MGVSALELRRRVLMEAPHRVIESGSFVNFDTFVRQKIPVIVNIAPVQAGSGDPSPENIRNISPWTSLKLTRTGKNIFDADSFFSNLKQSDGTFKGNTNATGFSKRIFTIPEELDGKTMTFSFDVDSITNEKIMCARYVNPAGSKSNGENVNSGVSYITKTVQTGGYFITAFNNNATAVIKWFCLKIGDTPENQPFGNAYNIPFPQDAGDVYGGTLTVNKDGTGQLVVDMMIGEITASKISSTTNLGNNRRTNIIRPFPYATTGANAAAISNMLPRVTRNYNADVTGFYIDGTNAMYAKFPIASLSEDSTDGVKALLTANPLIVCCPIGASARPVYNLSELQVIEALQGMNNVFADTGDVTVEFWKN